MSKEEIIKTLVAKYPSLEAIITKSNKLIDVIVDNNPTVFEGINASDITAQTVMSLIRKCTLTPEQSRMLNSSDFNDPYKALDADV